MAAAAPATASPAPQDAVQQAAAAVEAAVYESGRTSTPPTQLDISAPRAMPLAPCTGPLANPHPYQFSDASGTINLCTEYDAEGKPTAWLKRGRNGQSELPLALTGPDRAPDLSPEGVRLLANVQDGQGDFTVMVLALEFPWPVRPGLPAPDCGPGARYEEVRTYVLARNEVQEVSRVATKAPCLAKDKPSATWAMLALDPGLTPPARRYRLLVGDGSGPPQVSELWFGTNKDGKILRSFPFSA